MAEVKIVLVEPEYQINLGSVCRVMVNFGFNDLNIVNPKCKLGFDATKFAKHGLPVLQNAKIYKTLASATKGCDFIIGTTGITWRNKKTIRNPIALSDFMSKLKKEGKDAKFALLFGREGIGLNHKEIEACDYLVKIETSSDYPILNLSHAVAICLYTLSLNGIVSQSVGTNYVLPSKQEKDQLVKAFGLLVDYYKPVLRNPQKVKVAFSRVVGRSMISQIEAVSIIGVLRRAHRDVTEFRPHQHRKAAARARKAAKQK